MDFDETRRILAQVGFSDTEALVYCQLVRTPGSTGYSVAKSLKKSQANVYSALSSLTGKGAVSFANSGTKSYQAVPPSELLPRLSREFQEKCAEAEAALSMLSGTEAEDRVYQLRHYDQIYERAEVMCGRASESIVFGLFPIPFSRLRGALAAAVGRKVGVAGVTFDPDDQIPGATCALSVKYGRASGWPQATAWPRDQLSLVTDAQEALVALFDRETQEVLHALYTDSAYISCLFHAGLVDSTLLNLENPATIRESANKKLFGTVPSGFLKLIA